MVEVNAPLIEITDLSWTYLDTKSPVLSKVNLQVSEGECVVLTGPSGCGKTTLAYALNGLIPHFYEGEMYGSVRIGDKASAAAQPHELARRVGSVFQDPRSQFFTTSTTDEVAFGCENLAIPADEINRRVKHAFSVLGAEELCDRSIFELSSGQKQKIAIASVLAMQPSVLVLDEPSANLDNDCARMLTGVLTALKARGHTIVIAEHRLHYLMGVADKVILMEKGRIMDELPVEYACRIDYEQARRRRLRLPDLARVPLNPKRTDSPEAPTVAATDINASYKKHHVLEGVSFECSGPGQVIGIIGHNGAGKTTLLRVLSGLKAEEAGAIAFGDSSLSPKERITASAFVMQDADYQLFTESVTAELHFARSKSTDLETRIAQTLDALGLAEKADAHPMTLSGGQKQRLTIACALTSGSNVVFFDEPTSGLDGGTMRSVAALIRDMASQGRRIFVVTHDFEFIAEACDQVLCIQGGKVGAQYPVNEQARSRLQKDLQLS